MLGADLRGLQRELCTLQWTVRLDCAEWNRMEEEWTMTLLGGLMLQNCATKPIIAFCSSTSTNMDFSTSLGLLLIQICGLVVEFWVFGSDRILKMPYLSQFRWYRALTWLIRRAWSISIEPCAWRRSTRSTARAMHFPVNRQAGLCRMEQHGRRMNNDPSGWFDATKLCN